MTCKELIYEMYSALWLFFWGSIAVHVILIPAIKIAWRAAVEYLKTNLADHAAIAKMIQTKEDKE